MLSFTLCVIYTFKFVPNHQICRNKGYGFSGIALPCIRRLQRNAMQTKHKIFKGPNIHEGYNCNSVSIQNNTNDYVSLLKQFM